MDASYTEKKGEIRERNITAVAKISAPLPHFPRLPDPALLSLLPPLHFLGLLLWPLLYTLVTKVLQGYNYLAQYVYRLPAVLFTYKMSQSYSQENYIVLKNFYALVLQKCFSLFLRKDYYVSFLFCWELIDLRIVNTLQEV